MRRKPFAMIPLVIILLGAAIAGIFFAIDRVGFAGPEELQAMEISEYEGKNLSSVNDFRENSIKGPQHVDIAMYELEVTGLVEKPLSLTYDEVIDGYKHYKKMVRLNCVEGWSAEILWEGMLMRDILNEAGVLPETKTVIFHAYDDYTTPSR